MARTMVIRNVACRIPAGDHSNNEILQAIVNNTLTQTWDDMFGDTPIQKWRLEQALEGNDPTVEKSPGNNKWTPFCEDISKGVLDCELIQMSNGRSVRIFKDFVTGESVGGRAKGPSKGSISKRSAEREALEKVRTVIGEDAYTKALKEIETREASKMSEKDMEIMKLRQEVEMLKAAALKG